MNSNKPPTDQSSPTLVPRQSWPTPHSPHSVMPVWLAHTSTTLALPLKRARLCLIVCCLLFSLPWLWSWQFDIPINPLSTLRMLYCGCLAVPCCTGVGNGSQRGSGPMEVQVAGPAKAVNYFQALQLGSERGGSQQVVLGSQNRSSMKTNLNTYHPQGRCGLGWRWRSLFIQMN